MRRARLAALAAALEPVLLAAAIAALRRVAGAA